MPTPELSLEPDKHKINDDALPFLFQNVRAGDKAFYTAYGLVDIVGDVKEATVISLLWIGFYYAPCARLSTARPLP